MVETETEGAVVEETEGAVVEETVEEETEVEEKAIVVD